MLYKRSGDPTTKYDSAIRRRCDRSDKTGDENRNTLPMQEIITVRIETNKHDHVVEEIIAA